MYKNEIKKGKPVKNRPNNLEYRLIASLTKSSVVLGWDGKQEHYHLYKKEVNGQTEPEIISIYGKAYFDDDVEICKKYVYEVRGVDGAGVEGPASKPLTVNIVDNTRFRLYPKNFRIHEVGKDFVTLYWDEIKGVTAYVIYKKNDKGDCVEIARVGGDVLEYVDKGVKTDQVIQYAIETESLGGISQRSCITTKKYL